MRENVGTIIAVGGFTSNSGKTTLMCDLLGALPGSEAIKMTRGHYRSCGRDPHACCVSPLLSEEPLVRSGRAETYAAGKDTGRYWDAGASNVHWAIVTDKQVGQGIGLALGRVAAPRVLVEGNSFLKYVDADFVVLCARADGRGMKPSARRALSRADALYLFADGEQDGAAPPIDAAAWRELAGVGELAAGLDVYTREHLAQLVARIRAVEAHKSARAAGTRASLQNPGGRAGA